MLDRWVLRLDRKTATEGAEVTRSGRLFQTRAAATGKARSPTVRSRVRLTSDNQWWRWTGTESLTSLDICHLTKLVSKVYRCGPVQTLVHEDWLFVCNPLWSLQPVQLTKERSDVLEPRRGKDVPSSGIHHWLQPWQEIWWNAGECQIAVVQPREDERRHQRLKNRSRHWPADSPQLTQYRVATRYHFRDVRPHRDIAVDVNSKVSNSGSWWNVVGTDPEW